MCNLELKPFEVTTIFRVIGGGQAVRQAADSNIAVKIEKIENCDWQVKSQAHGVDSYTSIWGADLDDVKSTAKSWLSKGYGKVKFEVVSAQ